MYRSMRLSPILVTLLLLALLRPAKAGFERLLEDSVTSVETCNEDQVTSAVFSADGQIMTVSQDGVVGLWNRDMSQLISSYTDERGVSLAVSGPQNADVIVVTDRSDVTNRTTRTLLLDDKTGAVSQTLPGSYGAALGTDVVLTNGGGAPARLWDIETGNIVRELDQAFYDPVVSPDGQWVITVSDVTADYAKLWTFPEAELVFTFPDVDAVSEEASDSTFNYYSTGAFSSDSQVIALARGTSIFLWNRNDFRLDDILDNGQPISTMVFSNSGQFLLVGGKAGSRISGQAVLWDLKTGQIAHKFPALTQRLDVQSVAFSPDDRMALIVHDDGRVRLWDVNTGELVIDHSGCLSSL